MTEKVRIVAALHRIAALWAARNDYQPGHYISVTQAKSLRGLHASTAIIVIDSNVKFEDSRAIDAALTRFTNVKRISLFP